MHRIRLLFCIFSLGLCTVLHPVRGGESPPQQFPNSRAPRLPRPHTSLPAWLASSLKASELKRDLRDLSNLDPHLLKQGTWKVIRSAENARHLTFSGNGKSLGWLDEANMSLRVWTFHGEPKEKRLKSGSAGSWVDYFSLDETGTRGLVGLHRFQREESPAGGVYLSDSLSHLVFTFEGQASEAAHSSASEALRHSQGVWFGPDVFLAQTVLREAPALSPWSYPESLKALWFAPKFGSSPVNLDRRGVSYTLLDATPTRVLKPSYAPLSQRLFLGMGVSNPRHPTGLPKLVLHGLKKRGSFPGAFAELGQTRNLEFQVPGAPLSLAAAPDGNLFAYTHGAAGTLIDLGDRVGIRMAEDGRFAKPSHGLWLLRPHKDPVFVPHPQDAPCFEIAWRPDGLEIAVATDLDEDGIADIALYDLTPVLRNQQRRRAMLQSPSREAPDIAPLRAPAPAPKPASKTLPAPVLRPRQSPAAGLASPPVPATPSSSQSGSQARAERATSQAERLLSQNKIGPGLSQLARSIKLWPAANNPAYERLAKECIRRKLFSDGIGFIEKWIAAGGESPAKRYRVRLESAAGRHEKAILGALALCKENPFSSQEKELLGDIYYAAKSWDKALEAYRESKTLDPQRADLDAKIFQSESSMVLGDSAN